MRCSRRCDPEPRRRHTTGCSATEGGAHRRRWRSVSSASTSGRHGGRTDHDVGPVRRTLDVFGFHLARLDVRQNSAFHVRALTQLMSAAGIDGSQWEEWSEVERLRFLERELRSPRPFLHPSASAGPEADAVLQSHRVLAAHLARHGAEGVGSLIVSMTRRVSDLLVVFVLLQLVFHLLLTFQQLKHNLILSVFRMHFIVVMTWKKVLEYYFKVSIRDQVLHFLIYSLEHK